MSENSSMWFNFKNDFVLYICNYFSEKNWPCLQSESILQMNCHRKICQKMHLCGSTLRMILYCKFVIISLRKIGHVCSLRVFYKYTLSQEKSLNFHYSQGRFSRKRDCDISYKLSPEETICMKCQSRFSWGKKKKQKIFQNVVTQHAKH